MNSLDGVRVLDLSRVLAGPWCTQTLADLGADVIKIERPGTGDETRTWGPPFLKDAQGHDSVEAAYYLGTNRNKRSVTVDISRPQGQALIRRLAHSSAQAGGAEQAARDDRLQARAGVARLRGRDCAQDRLAPDRSTYAVVQSRRELSRLRCAVSQALRAQEGW